MVMVMAIVRYNDGSPETTIPYEQREKGYHIWTILNGEAEPENDIQAAYIARISNIYLNRRNDDCPPSYLRARAHVHARMDAGTKHVKAPGMTWADK